VGGVEVRRFRALPAQGTWRGFVAEYLVAAWALHVAAGAALRRGSTVLTLHNPPDILFGAGLLFRLAGRKVVFDHHDLFPETIAVKFGRGLAARCATAVAAACERLTFAVAHHVTSTNASYAEVAVTRGGKSAQEVTIVRNAPSRAWLATPSENRGGVLDHLELMYVGTIAGQDGVEGIAPVLARVAERVGVHLTVIGDGDARATLESALVHHGVRDRVTFTGWVAADRVRELLASADICVDPTPATDVNMRSTMVKLGEYLALGKPVVGYDLLEARRTAGDAACLVARGDEHAFADAIVRLASDPEQRLALAEKARRRAAELTWDHSERALLAVYRGLNGSGR
jgi:glycosyltransferase involved in cell wall biosynthesis